MGVNSAEVAEAGEKSGELGDISKCRLRGGFFAVL